MNLKRLKIAIGVFFAIIVVGMLTIGSGDKRAPGVYSIQEIIKLDEKQLAEYVKTLAPGQAHQVLLKWKEVNFPTN